MLWVASCLRALASAPAWPRAGSSRGPGAWPRCSWRPPTPACSWWTTCTSSTTACYWVGAQLAPSRAGAARGRGSELKHSPSRWCQMPGVSAPPMPALLCQPPHPCTPPQPGIFVLSLVAAAEERHLLAAALFAALLNLKHIFLYAAPAYFIFLLRRYCRWAGSGATSACHTASPCRPGAPQRSRCGACLHGPAFGSSTPAGVPTL
jgi:hypothetical protein